MSTMQFDAGLWIEQLRVGGIWIRQLLDATHPQHWTLRPAADKWSLLEILVHLVDEEREDFRVRLHSTLEDATRPWPPIDPEGWVRSRFYAERDPHELLTTWTRERDASVHRLQALGAADWSVAATHPILGRLRAGDLLCAWVAHDHLHGQQILRTRWQILEPATASFDARYAMP